MNVFIIGGTGYLGRVLVERLLTEGHTVTALARSEVGADRLREAGAAPVGGSIADVEVLGRESAAADAVIYAASDYAATEASMQLELDAVRAVVAGAQSDSVPGTAKPVVYTSTGLVYGFESGDSTEDAELPEHSAQPVKARAERIVLDAEGVTGIAVRASLIFGRGGSGLLEGLIGGARANGVSMVVGDGQNAWWPIHVDDLAGFYLRALERPVRGAFNVAGDVPFTFAELAGAIGELTGTPVVSLSLEEAVQGMGPQAAVLVTASRLPTAKARAAFDWQPSGRSLLDDVRHGTYAALLSRR